VIIGTFLQQWAPRSSFLPIVARIGAEVIGTHCCNNGNGGCEFTTKIWDHIFVTVTLDTIFKVDVLFAFVIPFR
jgi:hypothetical protein